MSEADTGPATTAARPVPLATLFRAGAPPPMAAPAAPRPERSAEQALEAAFESGHAAASAELGATIEMLQANLAAAERQRVADADAARILAASLAAAIEARFAHELATLALAATEIVLQAQPATPAATLGSLIAEAATGLDGGTLFLAPDEVELARPLAPPGWEVAARDWLDAGTVEAETGPALRRASLVGRLQQLLEEQ